MNEFVIEYITTLIKSVRYNIDDLKTQQLFYSHTRQEEFVLLLEEVRKLLELIIKNNNTPKN